MTIHQFLFSVAHNNSKIKFIYYDQHWHCLKKLKQLKTKVLDNKSNFDKKKIEKLQKDSWFINSST